MKVLALDLSRTTGFAHDGPDDGAPITGVWRLPPLDISSYGRAFAELFERVEDTVRLVGIDCLVFEAPLPVPAHVGRAHKDPDLAFALMGLAAVAECTGEYLKLKGIRPGLTIFSAHVQTVRRHFVGHGLPHEPKLAVQRMCRTLGWSVIDDNAADAAAVWCYAKSIKCPKWAPKGTPLFAEKGAA